MIDVEVVAERIDAFYVDLHRYLEGLDIHGEPMPDAEISVDLRRYINMSIFDSCEAETRRAVVAGVLCEVSRA